MNKKLKVKNMKRKETMLVFSNCRFFLLTEMMKISKVIVN